jgi:hypothetical protein
VLACVAAGQLISRLTSDCYAITRCIATNVNVALRNLLQVIGELQQWPDTPRLFLMTHSLTCYFAKESACLLDC